MADLLYLLWANDKQMWWRTDGWGYTPSVDEAGRFSETEALRYVVQSAHAGRLDAATVMVVDTSAAKDDQAAEAASEGGE